MIVPGDLALFGPSLPGTTTDCTLWNTVNVTPTHTLQIQMHANVVSQCKLLMGGGQTQGGCCSRSISCSYAKLQTCSCLSTCNTLAWDSAAKLHGYAV